MISLNKTIALLDRRPRGLIASVLAAGAATVLMASSASAESKSYVIGWMTQASYSQEGDCPRLSADQNEMYHKILLGMGKSDAEIEKLMEGFGGGHGPGAVRPMLINRGVIDGKPANVYNNPTSVPDPNLPTVTGKYAYGFNLDGKGAASPNSFEDPDTHEKGINNQYFRALGCVATHRGTMKERSTYWTYVWDEMRNSMPAWLVTISGNDLSKDGDVTVTFERALEHVEQDANSNTRPDMTFRVDGSNPHWHTTLPATIKNGVITTTKPVDFSLDADPYVINEWNIHNTHLRLTMKEDGTLDGLLGGYMPWFPIYYMYSHKGESDEMIIGLDLPGAYYALKKMADAEPDPATGQNMAISVAFHVEAVPAFTVRTDEPKAKTAAR